MRRGDIYLANLDPSTGAEANKTRPVIIVSNDHGNAAAQRLGRGVVTVVPLTSNVTRVYSFQVLVVDAFDSGLRQPSKAQVEQLRAIDVRRLTTRVGVMPADLMDHLDQALRLHLAVEA